jgi:hypothetical protein
LERGRWRSQLKVCKHVSSSTLKILSMLKMKLFMLV